MGATSGSDWTFARSLVRSAVPVDGVIWLPATAEPRPNSGVLAATTSGNADQGDAQPSSEAVLPPPPMPSP